MSAPRQEYERRLGEHQAAYQASERRHIWMGHLKLGVAAAGLLLLWLVAARHSFDWRWLIVPLVAYGGLALAHELTLGKRRPAQTAIGFYRRGIARIEDQWAGMGATGEEFREPGHVYSEDLDLFGNGCLFQLLSTARLPMGEKRLADWLKHGSSPEEVLERQGLVRELEDRLDLHRDLAIAGEELRARIAPERLMEWAEEKTVLPGPSCRILAAVLSVGAAAGIAEYVEGGSKWPLLAVLAIEGLLLTWLGKKAKEAIAKIDCNAEGLQLFAEVLERFEKVTFASARLQSISRELVEAQGVTGIEKSDSTRSSVAVRRLARVVYWVDAQDNFILKLAKLPFLYTLQVALAAEAWKRRFGGRLRRWMEIGGEMEALVSLGTYAYEHPHDVFPEFVGPGGEALFDGEALGHPLIAEAQCVRNSVRLDARTRVLLVSGSNMSGKSTLLRTVGINAVLAMAGAPVRAARLHMTPLEIGTRIRSGDSLQEGRSNFYTEILHLRQVFDLLGTKGGQLELVELPRRGADGIDDERPRRPAPESLDPPSARLLFLFDELLDGTNSHDRRIAAERLLRTLVEGGAIGMVTTHDLALTEMGALLQDQLRNVHFEDQVAEGKMRFDYRLRDGVLTKSNAIELMRIIGLDV